MELRTSSDIQKEITSKYPKYFVRLFKYNKIDLEPEKFNGNIEYKRTIAHCNDYKIQQYATQMRWRIMENIKHQYAIYYIGIDDDGTVIGLDIPDLLTSIDNFIKMADSIGASITGINIIEQLNPFKLILKIGVKIKKSAQICPDI